MLRENTFVFSGPADGLTQLGPTTRTGLVPVRIPLIRTGRTTRHGGRARKRFPGARGWGTGWRERGTTSPLPLSRSSRAVSFRFSRCMPPASCYTTAHLLKNESFTRYYKIAYASRMIKFLEIFNAYFSIFLHVSYFRQFHLTLSMIMFLDPCVSLFSHLLLAANTLSSSPIFFLFGRRYSLPPLRVRRALPCLGACCAPVQTLHMLSSC